MLLNQGGTPDLWLHIRHPISCYIIMSPACPFGTNKYNDNELMTSFTS